MTVFCKGLAKCKELRKNRCRSRKLKYRVASARIKGRMGGGWEGAMGTPKRRLGERGEGSGYGAVSRKLKYLS